VAGVDRGRERELKFEVDEAFLLPDLGPGTGREPHEVVLTADYWDTDDLRLLRWGHSLRHRRASDGSEDGWTLKLAVPGSSGAGASRDELNLRAPPGAVPSELRDLVAAFARRARLANQATLETRRRTAILGGDAGKPSYELADDLVTSRVGPAAGPTFRQVEVEAVGGRNASGGPSAEEVEAGLDEIARVLEAAGAGPAGSVAKVAVVLADRLGAPEVVVPELDQRATIAGLVGGSLAAGLRRLLLHDPYVRIGDDPEAVHQARVATRRLRSDLRTLSPLLEPAPVTRWRADLAWLGGLLGRVRDLDVLGPRLGRRIDDVAHPADRPGGEWPGAERAGAALIGGVRSERDVRRAVLVDVLGSARYLGLLDELVAAAAAPPLAAGVDGEDRAAPVAAELTRVAWRRLRRSVPAHHDAATDTELHEVRKRAKQARYAAELADGVLRGELAPLATRLAALQEVLGELQDAVSAAAWLADVAPHADGDVAFLAGRLLERELQARAAARDAWWATWRRARHPTLRDVL
jgi:CHAD domain-containing protein